MRRARIVLILLAVASIAATGYIFANSIQSSEGSHERSEQVSEQIQQIVQPDNVNKESEEWDVFVRKAAHGIEFAALGLCTAGFFICLSQKRNRGYVCAPLLYTLLVAVTDEYIQVFTKRTSEVRDVLIDFTGACCGLVLAVGLYFLVCFIVGKVRKSNTETSEEN